MLRAVVTLWSTGRCGLPEPCQASLHQFHSLNMFTCCIKPRWQQTKPQSPCSKKTLSQSYVHILYTKPVLGIHYEQTGKNASGRWSVNTNWHFGVGDLVWDKGFTLKNESNQSDQNFSSTFSPSYYPECRGSDSMVTNQLTMCYCRDPASHQIALAARLHRQHVWIV